MNNSNSTRLYRSREHRVFGGVAGGLADYFNIDVILARLLFVVIFLAGGGGVIIYVILWIITPEEPLITPSPYEGNGFGGSSHNNTDADISDATIVSDGKKQNNNKTFIAGMALILIGFLFLINTMMPQLVILQFWPIIIIVVGIMLVVNEVKPTQKENSYKESSKTKNNEI